MKRRISVKNLVLAFILAVLFFVVGIFLGDIIVEKKYSGVDSFISDLRLQTMSMELQYNLLEDEPCKAVQMQFFTDELSLLNSRLENIEQSYGKSHPDIMRIKQYYSILQIRHWMLYKKAQKTCNQNSTLILYFYSNDKCKDCEDQGNVLTSFRKKYPDEVKVYSFDINLDDPALKALISIYNIGTAPTVVYNDAVFPGYVSFQFLEKLKENSNSYMGNLSIEK